MLNSRPRWLVLRTKPYREKEVAAQLDVRSIEAYFPQLKAFRKYLGAGKRQVEPLFPCYVFVRVNLAGRHELDKLGGARELVRFGSHVPHLDDEFIRELRRRETADGYIRIRPARPALLPTAPVRVTAGPFAGCDGLFSHHLNAPERVSVLLDMLHSRVSVELPADHVERLTTVPPHASTAPNLSPASPDGV